MRCTHDIGSVELDSAGVSVSLFNIISKLFNIPLLSVAASFCLKHIKKCRQVLSNSESLIDVVEKLQLSSVSTALTLAIGIGIYEAMALSLGTLLGLMEISSENKPLTESLAGESRTTRETDSDKE
ncbi:MATE efflux family protein [Striga asiatica]|uniref:MATE efflux family protein n=1 Tax=Striga asiatica TaxID=4170 RepID=A0A5A7Q120_STRAF|nr:MATE efflux family protein [Striga asiatica]